MIIESINDGSFTISYMDYNRGPELYRIQADEQYITGKWGDQKSIAKTTVQVRDFNSYKSLYYFSSCTLKMV